MRNSESSLRDSIPQLFMNGDINLSWRTSDGRYFLISDLDVDHLFNIIRVVWNNHVKDEGLIVQPYKKYLFPELYTDEYIRERFVAMMKRIVTVQHCLNKNQVDDIYKIISSMHLVTEGPLAFL